MTVPATQNGSSNPYEISETWSKYKDYHEPFDYKIEGSGQLCQIRRLDMGDFLKLGIAEEMDFMSKELMTSDKPDKGAEAVNNAILKADNFKNMERMINLVCVAGVIQPKLVMPPTDPQNQKRQAGLIYADSIPFGDRMELFSVIFDTEGLSDFREEQDAGVGDVEHVPSVQLPPDRPVEELRPENTEGVLSE